jgi:nitrogen fixation protein NifX
LAVANFALARAWNGACNAEEGMKVAFATQDLAHVDAHFGWAPHLVVYEVTPEGSRLEHTHAFPPAEEDGVEDKLEPRIAAIAGCALVCVAAIGPSAAARLAQHRIRPATAAGETRIEELLAKLSHLLASGPPPWLRRALGEAPGEAA